MTGPFQIKNINKNIKHNQKYKKVVNAVKLILSRSILNKIGCQERLPIELITLIPL